MTIRFDFTRYGLSFLLLVSALAVGSAHVSLLLPLLLSGLPCFPCMGLTHNSFLLTLVLCAETPCSNPKTELISLLFRASLCNSADLLVTYFLATSRQLHTLIFPNTLVWLYLTLHFTHCHTFLLPFFLTFFHIRPHQCIQR